MARPGMQRRAARTVMAKILRSTAKSFIDNPRYVGSSLPAVTAIALPALPGAGPDPAALVLAWLAGKRSVHTRRAYGRDLVGWLTWCANNDTDPLGAVETHAAGWARRMESDGLAATTIARKLSAASSWYSWLLRGVTSRRARSRGWHGLR